MKVFLSWSGETSQKVAVALRDWLPAVLQSLEPWLSSEDITAGARWGYDIAKALEESRVGIICLTQDNLDSRWLNFEAGALAKNIDASHVCIYLFDVKPSSVSGPLPQFQFSQANKEDTFRLLKSLNSISETALGDGTLKKIFQLWWPALEARFKEIAVASLEKEEAVPNSLLEDKKLDEILEICRRFESGQQEIPKSEQAHRTKQPKKSLSEKRPRLFIGSSTEGLSVAEAVQLGLDDVAECTLWTQGAFNLSQTTIESIVDATAKFDFAVLVFTPDDMTIKRGKIRASARDNILFELGLFTGALGRARTFMVFPRDSKPEFPSDLSGVTAATYADRTDGNLEAALGPVCTRIKRAMGVAK